jgi:hypothetical protein
LEQFDDDLVQRCLCGLRKYIQRKMPNGNLVFTAAVKASAVMVPQRGTKIYRCFSAIGRSWPRVVMTAEVARITSLNGKETAALLIALMARGLIARASERRGMTGGSEWKLTAVAEPWFRRR